MTISTLFSGIGAPETALKRLGIDYNLAYFCDIDKYAVKSYCEIHSQNESKNLGDITKVDIDKLPKGLDLIVGGSPCFLAGELVNTKQGLTKIENIKPGDLVKSHNGSYNEVVKLFTSNNNLLADIRCSAVHNINTTTNHPFYALKDNNVNFYEVNELTTNDYLMIPINKNANEPSYNGMDIKINQFISEHRIRLPITNSILWYIAGRYIGDGWIKYKYRNGLKTLSGVVIACNKNKFEKFKSIIGNLYKYTIAEEKSIYKITICDIELANFLIKFGVGAINKNIPQEVLDLDNKYLQHLHNGIMDSDGCFTKNTYKVTSVSKELVYNIGELVLKIYRLPYNIYKDIRPKTCIIQGREVNQRNTYMITWRTSYCKNVHFVDNDYLYTRIKKITLRNEMQTVYNIEVANTHTYCVNNVAVHNCQDFSLAGKGKGGNIDSKTRSSLMWNYLAIIEQSQPKVILWENVPGVLTEKHNHNYKKFHNRLNEIGYKVYAKVLNAKDFGVPQNRKRIFVLGIRKDLDIDFKMPTGYDCGIRLKDMLEEKVDEKYYLSQKAIDGITNSKFAQKQQIVQNTNDIYSTILMRDFKDPKCVCENALIEITANQPQGNRIYSENGLSVTLSANGGGMGAKTGLYAETVVKDVFYNPYNNSIIKDFAPTQTTSCGSLTTSATCLVINSALKQQHKKRGIMLIKGIAYWVRKLTPLECWRLMGFSDTDFYLAQKVNSNAQLYKQAGNSIVVNVLMAIFGQLYKIDWKPLVYGRYYKTETERMAELPLLRESV